MTFEQFEEYWKRVILKEKTSHIRKGQSLMNYLAEVWIEEYKRLSSVHYYSETNIDCYYNDDLISNTLQHLKNVWKNYGT